MVITRRPARPVNTRRSNVFCGCRTRLEHSSVKSCYVLYNVLAPPQTELFNTTFYTVPDFSAIIMRVLTLLLCSALCNSFAVTRSFALIIAIIITAGGRWVMIVRIFCSSLLGKVRITTSLLAACRVNRNRINRITLRRYCVLF